MTLGQFFSKMMLSRKDAEVIFDRDEPIGRTTDVVMPPPRRWFRREKSGAQLLKRPSTYRSYNS